MIANLLFIFQLKVIQLKFELFQLLDISRGQYDL